MQKSKPPEVCEVLRVISAMALCVVVVAGCARTEPVLPASTSQDFSNLIQISKSPDGPYRLWGEFSLFINDNHDNVVVVPKRASRFHLNALKFLESYCADCLQITGIQNNGDGTADLTVKITHPFPNHPEYTGFDVKGIIMFSGSNEIDTLDKYPMYPKYYLSWRLLGDPQVLNPDGFTYRWSPWYDSGSDLPIFNYWEGKYANGTPTANINAYLDFYSTEERHAFYCNAWKSRTYHLSLPAGPVVAGYAVEACWEPPLVTPVTDPQADFPITANMPEPYYLKVVINDGNAITDPYCCNWANMPSVHEARVESLKWYIPEEASQTYPYRGIALWTQELWGTGLEYGSCCGSGDGPDNWYITNEFPASFIEDGQYQGVGVFWYINDSDGDAVICPTLTAFEFEIDLE
jgi:hypothetical protein